MEGLRQYLISVTAAAMICGIAKTVADEKTVSGAVIRLVAGLVMTVTVLAPVVRLDLGVVPELTAGIAAEAKQAAAVGEDLAEEELRSIIIDRLEAYILDKAAAFGARLQVEILMPEDGSIEPEGIILRGDVSPYAKQRLQQIITEDLNIAKEKQQWIG